MPNATLQDGQPARQEMPVHEAQHDQQARTSAAQPAQIAEQLSGPSASLPDSLPEQTASAAGRLGNAAPAVPSALASSLLPARHDAAVLSSTSQTVTSQVPMLSAAILAAHAEQQLPVQQQQLAQRQQQVGDQHAWAQTTPDAQHMPDLDEQAATSLQSTSVQTHDDVHRLQPPEDSIGPTSRSAAQVCTLPLPLRRTRKIK